MSIIIIRGEKTRNTGFQKVLECVWENPNLSIKAKGLITYCLTKPATEAIDIPKISKSLGIGRDSARASINECIDMGYAYRRQFRSENGLIGRTYTWISGSKEDIRNLRKNYEECEGIVEEKDKITAFNEI